MKLQNIRGDNMNAIVQTMKDKHGKDFVVGMNLYSAMFPQVKVKCIDIKDGMAHLRQSKKESPIILNQKTLDMSQWEVRRV